MWQDREIKGKDHPDQGKLSMERILRLETVCLVVPSFPKYLFFFLIFNSVNIKCYKSH